MTGTGGTNRGQYGNEARVDSNSIWRGTFLYWHWMPWRRRVGRKQPVWAHVTRPVKYKHVSLFLWIIPIFFSQKYFAGDDPCTVSTREFACLSTRFDGSYKPLHSFGFSMQSCSSWMTHPFLLSFVSEQLSVTLVERWWAGVIHFQSLTQFPKTSFFAK